MINPPIKNPITAIKEGTCRSDKPDIACPDVQPPAYRVPNPIKNPPPKNKISPRQVSRNFQLKIADGSSWPSNGICNCCRSATVAADNRMGSPDGNQCTINPPIMEPTRNQRFHCSFFQSKLKKPTSLPAPIMEQILDRFEEKPNDFPKNNSPVIINAIANPETYQGQGWLINESIMQ